MVILRSGKRNSSVLGNLHEWQVFLETFELTFELFGQGGAHGGDVACAALEQLGNALQVCPVCGVVGGGWGVDLKAPSELDFGDTLAIVTWLLRLVQFRLV